MCYKKQFSFSVCKYGQLKVIVEVDLTQLGDEQNWEHAVQTLESIAAPFNPNNYYIIITYPLEGKMYNGQRTFKTFAESINFLAELGSSPEGGA